MSWITPELILQGLGFACIGGVMYARLKHIEQQVKELRTAFHEAVKELRKEVAESDKRLAILESRLRSRWDERGDLR